MNRHTRDTFSPISPMIGFAPSTSMVVLDGGVGSGVAVSGTDLGFRCGRLLLLGGGSSVPTGSGSATGRVFLRRLGRVGSGSGSGVGVVTGVCSSCCAAVMLRRDTTLVNSRRLRAAT